MRTKILEILYAAVAEVNKQLPPDARVPASEAALLTGPKATLDSLAFLSLIVTAEDLIGATLKKPVQVAAALAESADTPPPPTLGALADLIVSKLEGADRG